MKVHRSSAAQPTKQLTVQDLNQARSYAQHMHQWQTQQAVHPTLQKEYIAHAIQVSKLLKRHGASIAEQMAGVLHGIPKNVPIQRLHQLNGQNSKCAKSPRTRQSETKLLQDIEQKFDKDIRTMVAGITDLPSHVAPWLPRKLHYIQQIQATELRLPANQKALAPSILKLSIADEQAAMVALIENIKRAKALKLDPQQVFQNFKTDGLPPKEALLWFFNKLDQTYHQLVNASAFPNAQGKGLLQVYDDTLKTLTDLAQPNMISTGLIRLKSHWTSVPNNPPQY